VVCFLELACSAGLPSVAILYTTCDDFEHQCCQSCLDQDYSNCRVIVCDDSEEDKYKSFVKEFCSRRDVQCILVHRPDRQGYKAGNLNYAISNFVKEDYDYILLVDADQSVPRNFVTQLVRELSSAAPNVAFVQAAHRAESASESSQLQRELALDVSTFYIRDLAVRNSFGFVPLLGHGALIRTKILEEAGGFPEVVSEDFPLSLVLACKRWRGNYVRHIVSGEALPFDFGGFMTRIRKFAGGTAELVKGYLGSFLKGPSSLIEKWDFLMMIGWYLMPLIVTANGFLSASVCHVFWKEKESYLHPLLPFLFLWLWFAQFTVGLSVADRWCGAVRFYFWVTAVYTSALPLTGYSFLKHLIVKPSFKRTPKGRVTQSLRGLDIALMVGFGLCALVLSIVWVSPFSPYFAGQDVAYLSYPLYGVNSFAGRTARVLVYLPGIFMIVSLYTMWAWNYF
jgi:cellulose synthase/poly-beta-1,6-N-acetylglucosamine synthase-like glycosyltransferase